MSKHQRVVELPYARDSASRYQHLAGLPWFVFLDSCFPQAPLGRFDIIAARPRATLCTRGGVTAIREGNELQLSDGDPIELLRERLGGPVEGIPGIPFCGGALGYFAYDLGRRFERLPELAQRDLDLPDMAIGVYDWAVVVDHEQQRSWLVAARPEVAAGSGWADVLALVSGGLSAGGSERLCTTGFQLQGTCRSNMTRDEYAAAFSRIKRHIAAGDCYQVNFAQRFSAPVAGDAWAAYLRLRAITPAPYSGFMRLSDGAVLSSSPERFLRVRAGAVETRPIKGTRPRLAAADADEAMARALLDSEKDRAENVMIVDLLRNDIGKVCRPGSVRVPELWKIESFARVHHLVSTVTGELDDGADALELLRHCFPGGSITGAPKIRAMEIIESLEPHRRSVYCGALGYVGVDGNMDTNIAIRTMAWHGGMLHAWAGGGIVADSQMEAEYQESFDKASGMLALMSREPVSGAIS